MKRDRHLFAGMTVAAALLMPAVSLAQSPPKTQPPVAPKTDTTGKTEQPGSTACAPSDTRSTVGKGAATDAQKPADANLSDKLAKSSGVICPPADVDHDIKAPTPQGGAMPVIPPPGSPGGDQSVKPK